jgi:DNA-binding NarL/FixJ family response regulator
LVQRELLAWAPAAALAARRVRPFEHVVHRNSPGLDCYGTSSNKNGRIALEAKRRRKGEARLLKYCADRRDVCMNCSAVGSGGSLRREQEVMALVVAGRLNKQVGFELGISAITVKAHRGRVMRKMEAASLPDLVNVAAKLRLAPAPTR